MRTEWTLTLPWIDLILLSRDERLWMRTEWSWTLIWMNHSQKMKGCEEDWMAFCFERLTRMIYAWTLELRSSENITLKQLHSQHQTRTSAFTTLCRLGNKGRIGSLLLTNGRYSVIYPWALELTAPESTREYYTHPTALTAPDSHNWPHYTRQEMKGGIYFWINEFISIWFSALNILLHFALQYNAE